MTPGQILHLHSWGCASSPPAVLLHGFTGYGGSWATQAEAFSAAGYRVLAPDLLGHGSSPAPARPDRYRMERAAGDLSALLEANTDDHVHLLGYSMGGRLALYFALNYPAQVRSLTLESASPGLATESERAQRRERDNDLADRIEREGIAAFVDVWESLPLWENQGKLLSTEQRRQLRAQRLRNRPAGLANSLRGIGAGAQQNLRPRLPALAAPTLLLAGGDDRKFVSVNQEMANLIPNANFVVIPQTGHNVHLERPSAFSSNVLSFWRYCDGDSREPHRRRAVASKEIENSN